MECSHNSKVYSLSMDLVLFLDIYQSKLYSFHSFALVESPAVFTYSYFHYLVTENSCRGDDTLIALLQIDIYPFE